MQIISKDRTLNSTKPIYQKQRMVFCSTALLLIMFGMTGCNLLLAPFGALNPSMGFLQDQLAYNDPVDEFMLGWRNYVWAKKAWSNYRSCHRDIPYLEDFGRGYRAGYVDVANGGDGCTPIMAPRRYWSWKYQTPEGQCKVQQWFAAFALGAAQADSDGVDNWSQIQTSVDLADHLQLDEKEALRGVSSLRESNSNDNLPNAIENLPIDDIFNDPILGPDGFEPSPGDFNRGSIPNPDIPPLPAPSGFPKELSPDNIPKEIDLPKKQNDNEVRIQNRKNMYQKYFYTNNKESQNQSSRQPRIQNSREIYIQTNSEISKQRVIKQPKITSQMRPIKKQPLRAQLPPPQATRYKTDVKPILATPPVFKSSNIIKSNYNLQPVVLINEQPTISNIEEKISIRRLPSINEKIDSLKRPNKVYQTIPRSVDQISSPIQKPVLLKR